MSGDAAVARPFAGFVVRLDGVSSLPAAALILARLAVVFARLAVATTSDDGAVASGKGPVVSDEARVVVSSCIVVGSTSEDGAEALPLAGFGIFDTKAACRMPSHDATAVDNFSMALNALVCVKRLHHGPVGVDGALDG